MHWIHISPHELLHPLLSPQGSSFPQQRKKAEPPHCAANTLLSIPDVWSHCKREPRGSRPSKGLHPFWGTGIWTSWHRTAQEFLIFFHFFLQISVPTSRELTWSVCCSPQNPWFPSQTLTCDKQVTSILIKWNHLILLYPTSFSFLSFDEIKCQIDGSQIIFKSLNCIF